MPKKTKKTEEAAPAAANAVTPTPAPEEAMVTLLKTTNAPKLSPRGGGLLTYQVGRMGETVLLRIHKNDSSGRFSAEWVSVEAIRKSLAQLPKGATSFKGAVALKTAWKGQSSCNSGFGAAILRGENVFASDEDPKKKGMLKLASPDALDAWEKRVLALPVPKDAERVPLHPPKPVPNFAKRTPKPAPAGDDAAQPGPDDEPAESGAAATGEQAPAPDEEE